MNKHQTGAEASRQIRKLMEDSTPEERGQLKKYIKPISEAAQTESPYQGGPVHISEVLPDVMDNIERRCARQERQCVVEGSK